MRPSARLCLSHSKPVRAGSSAKKPVLPPTIRSRLAESASGTTSDNSTSQTTSSGSSGADAVGRMRIDGWLKSVRGHKNVIFGEVGDGSGEGLQAVFKGKAMVEGYVLVHIQTPRYLLPRRGRKGSI
jgi:hypothetical protein